MNYVPAVPMDSPEPKTYVMPPARYPSSTTWRRVDPAHLPGLAGMPWHHRRRRLTVISSIRWTELPQSNDQQGPTWHISVSRNGSRCSDADVLLARRAFGMLLAEEDNHHPGVARHLFLPVDPAYAVLCECKLNERTVVEVDGYTWTTPIDGRCRGCDFELLSRGRHRCPLHNT